MAQLYSHSRLSSFEDCPQKFQYRYVLKIPSDSEGVEGFVGKRVHEVLERLYLAVGRGQVPSQDQVLKRFRALFDEHYDAERVRIVRTENSLDFYRELGERCLSGFYRRHYPFDADHTLGIEKRVILSLDHTGEYRVQGIVDRIAEARDGAIEIQDYKTGAWVPPQEQLDRDRQLALYQMGIGESYGPGRPIRLVWHYLQRNQVRTSTRTPEQLEELRCATIGLIDRIRAEDRYEAKPGPLCRWCEYAERCPLGPEGPGEPARRPPEAPPREVAQPPTAAEAPDAEPPPKRGQLSLL